MKEQAEPSSSEQDGKLPVFLDVLVPSKNDLTVNIDSLPDQAVSLGSLQSSSDQSTQV